MRFAGSSCPVYIEQIEAGPEQVYVLNCRPADTIAAGATVVFAMQLRILATAPTENSLTWELAPKTYQPPFTGAAVSIVRSGLWPMTWLIGFSAGEGDGHERTSHSE